MDCEQPGADREREDRKAGEKERLIEHSRYEEERQAEEDRKYSIDRAERE